MDLTVDKGELTHLLYFTSSLIEKRNAMPILASIRIDARRNSLKISATNLETSVVVFCKAEVKEPGSIAVDAKIFNDIIRELPEGNVALTSISPSRLCMKSSLARFDIVGSSTDEFPEISGVSVEEGTTIDPSVFCEMLDKTSFCISKDETRYELNGIYVESPEESDLCLVAADGHRLSVIKRTVPGLFLEESIIIPRKGVVELKKVVGNVRGIAKIEIKRDFLTLATENLVIGIRLLKKEYPDYRQIMPEEYKLTISIDPSRFLSSIKRVALVSFGESKPLILDLTSGSLTISASSPEYGEAQESIPIEGTRDDMSISVSSGYLLDAISAMQGSELVEANFSGEGEFDPIVLNPVEDTNYKCLIMPVRC